MKLSFKVALALLVTVLVERADKVPRAVGKSDETMASVLLKLSGDAPGVMLLLFPPQHAKDLARLLIEESGGSNTTAADSEEAVLQEAGNILAGAAMTALSSFLNVSVLQSVPDMATGTVSALVDAIPTEVSGEADMVLVCSVDFKVKGEDIEGHMFLVFDQEATAKMLAIMKKMSGFFNADG